MRLGYNGDVAGLNQVTVQYTIFGQTHLESDEVNTDSTGHYVIPGLAPGSYSLYFEFHGTGYSSEWSRQAPTDTVPASYGAIVLTTSDVDFSPNLPATVTIAGYVTLGTAGVLPAPGTVHVAYRLATADNLPFSSPVDADSAGHYSIPNVTSGTYQLKVTYTGSGAHEPTWYLSLSGGDSQPPQSNDGFGVQQGVPVNIVIPDFDPNRTGFGYVSGTVYLGSTLTVSPFNEVWLSVQRFDTATSSWGDPDHFASVDNYGHYTIGGLQPGTYRILAQYQGGFFQPSFLKHFADGYWSSTLGGLTPTNVTIAGDSRLQGYDFVLNPPVTQPLQIQGTVSVPNWNGFSPQRDVGVNVFDLSGNAVAYVTTDTDGVYAVTGLAPGSYHVQAVYWNPNNPQPYAGSWLGGSPFASLSTTLVIGANSRYTGQDFRLTPGASISGTISWAGYHDPTGYVWAYLRDPITHTLQLVGGSPTDALGNYEVKSLPAGSYIVKFIDAVTSTSSPPSLYRDRYWVDTTDVNQATSISLAVGQAVSDVDATMRIPAGTLVRLAITGSSEIFMVDGVSNLIGVGTVGNVQLSTDAGFSTVTAGALTVDQISGFNRSEGADVNLLNCGSAGWFFAGDGKLYPVNASAVTGLPFTSLQPETCATAPHSSVTPGALLVQRGTAGSVYLLANGVKRPLAGANAASSLSSPGPAVIAHITTAYLDSIPLGPPVLGVGSLVKTASSSIYLVDGLSKLVPVSSAATAIDAGFSSTITTVAASALTSYSIASAPLSNVIMCDGNEYLAADSKLYPVDAAPVSGLPVTNLESSTCAAVTRSSVLIKGALLVQANSGGVTYYVASGVKRQLLGASAGTALAAPNAAVVVHTSSVFLSSLPAGASVIPPASLVKSSSGTTIYLADGFNRLLPVWVLSTVTDAGISGSYYTVPQSDLAGMTVSATPTRNVIICPTQTYFAGSGKVWPVAPSIVANLTSMTLQATTCAALPKGAQQIAHALFVKTPSDPWIYNITPGGAKRPVIVSTMMALMAAPDPVVVLNVGDIVLAPLRQGVDLVPAGTIIRLGWDTVPLLVDGAGGTFKLRSTESVTDFGFSAGSHITNTVTYNTMPPAASGLNNIVSCGGQVWIAGKGSGIGQLWHINASNYGSIAVTTLPSTLCAFIVKNANPAPTNVLLKASNGTVIYSLEAGKKRPIASDATAATMGAGNPVAYLTVNPDFLASIPTGTIP